MNDLSAFDGDAERERQICDFRVKGKTESEVCQMLGVTASDIHRALNRAAQVLEPGRRRNSRRGLDRLGSGVPSSLKNPSA